MVEHLNYENMKKTVAEWLEATACRRNDTEASALLEALGIPNLLEALDVSERIVCACRWVPSRRPILRRWQWQNSNTSSRCYAGLPLGREAVTRIAAGAVGLAELVELFQARAGGRRGDRCSAFRGMTGGPAWATLMESLTLGECGV